jgi:UMF1 family MFS transporter
VAVTSPILGAIADYSGSKKPFLLFYTIMAIVFTGALFFAQAGRVAMSMSFFILAEIGYRSAQVFYNGFLPEIADPEDIGRISGTGWAVGTAGGVICLIIILALILTVGGDFIVRLSLVITAVFFALSALPIFLWLPERAKKRPLPSGDNYLSIAFKQLANTIRTAGSFKEFVKFMVAFLIYNDGVMMALDFAAIIGAVLFGIDQQGLIIFVIGFYIIGAVAGFAMAGTQSVSRTMVGMFSPPGKSAEFYGFFALAGRTSSFIGPTVFGIVAAEAALYYLSLGQSSELADQAGHRLAILSIAVFFIAGLLILTFVDENKARHAAQQGKGSGVRGQQSEPLIADR